MNPNKKLVSFIDFDFDPMGKTLRKDEHHTLFENGLRLHARHPQIGDAVADEEGKFDEYCVVEPGEVDFKGPQMPQGGAAISQICLERL